MSRSVIRDLSHGQAAFNAFSRLNAMGSAMPVLAPLLGGLLLPLFGWRGLFAAIAIYVVFTAGLVWRFMPESLPHEHRTGGDWGEIRRVAGTVLRNRIYLGYVLTVCLVFGSVLGYVSASSFVFQRYFGLTPEQYAIAFACNSVGIMVASAINARLVSRRYPADILRVGMAGQVLVVALIAIQFVSGVAQVATILPLTFLFMLSIGFTTGNATALAMNAVGTGLGTAAALLGGMQFAFGSFTSPLVGLGGAANPIPMVIVMALCSSLALVMAFATRRAERARDAAALPEAGPAIMPAVDLELRPTA